jgi:tetratricopeptide (TPR) repeat protein
LTSNGPSSAVIRFFVHPAALAAAAAVAVRLVAGLAGLSQNPILTSRQLDTAYYLAWAADIANGDVLGREGIVGGEPFILNPLYAYVLAPLVGASQEPWTRIVVAQALLAGATAALAALAAQRFFGRTAAWTAGLAVAFSAALVQLDAHVAVSGLAAFLTAGAVFASAPAREGASGRGHGPVARGLWLGLGALARPITPVALPFFAWAEWKRDAAGRTRRLALLAGAFVACALPSLLRNWSVSGEPVLFTTSSGLNLHIGNNAESRRVRTMASQHTSFEPRRMHDDARAYAFEREHRVLSRSEVSSFFTRLAVDELLREPGPSLAFYANKARWFASPAEVPSTASLSTDLRFAPVLHVAFVPTWIVAAAGLVGLVLHRRRRDVLCGPGALVLAHLFVLTLVFPISHYRSPAIPALAVLAGGAVEAAVAAWRANARGRTCAIAGAVAAVAALGAVPPQPDAGRHADAMLLGYDARDRGRFDEAIAYAEEARTAYREDIGDGRDLAPAWVLRASVELVRRRYPDAIAALDHVLELQPQNVGARLDRSKAARLTGRFQLAESDAREVLRDRPDEPAAHLRLGEVLFVTGRRAEAVEHLLRAEAGGIALDPELRRALPLR